MGQAKARGTFAERQALAVVERERLEALRAERDKAEAAKLRELGRQRREAEYAQRQMDLEAREAVEKAEPRHSAFGPRRIRAAQMAGISALVVASMIAIPR